MVRHDGTRPARSGPGRISEEPRPGRPRSGAAGPRRRAPPGTTATICPAPSVGVADVVHDPPHLQADQQEDGVLQQELDGVPVDPLAQPRGGVLDHRRLVAEQQPGDDDRDHARRRAAPRPAGRPANGAMNDSAVSITRVVDGACGPGRPATATTTPIERRRRRAAQQEVEATSPTLTVAPASATMAVRSAHQRGRVVEQRLALQDRDDPAGQADPAGDGRGRDGVRWCHDGAEGERRRERAPAAATRSPGPTPSAVKMHQPDRRASRSARRFARSPPARCGSRRRTAAAAAARRRTTSEDRCDLGDERQERRHRCPTSVSSSGADRLNRRARPATAVTVATSARAVIATSTGESSQVGLRPGSGVDRARSQPSTAVRRVSRPTPPRSSARRWNALRSKSAPSRACTSSRSCSQIRSPTLYDGACPGQPR